MSSHSYGENHSSVSRRRRISVDYSQILVPYSGFGDCHEAARSLCIGAAFAER